MTMAIEDLRRRRRKRRVDLNDDVVLEVFSRLPLRQIIQCMTLNRSLRAAISETSFTSRCCAHRPVIFHYYVHESSIFSTVALDAARSVKSVTLADPVRVVRSCNGVLLLSFRREKGLFVYNPLMGRALHVDNVPASLSGNPGFVIESGMIKLVIFKEVGLNEPELYFDVFDLASGNAMHKSQTIFPCEGFKSSICPVYAYGCLHWLEEGGRRIASFDVANERTRTIAGPLAKVKSNSGPTNLTGRMWFGLAHNELQFLLSTESDKITIFSHDPLQNQWRIMHQMQNICDPTSHAYQNCKPMFFDGWRLFQLFSKKRGRGKVFAYDLLSKDWEFIGRVGEKKKNHHDDIFVPFIPTLEKVISQDGCSRLPQRNPAAVENCFHQLQQLLRN